MDFKYYITVVSLLAGCAFTLFLVFYPFQVLTLSDDGIRTEKESYLPGETITYIMDYCKHFNTTSGAISKSIELEGGKITWPNVNDSTTKPCKEERFTNTDFKVPDDLPPGSYRVKFLFTFRVLSFRTVKETHEMILVVRAPEEVTNTEIPIRQISTAQPRPVTTNTETTTTTRSEGKPTEVKVESKSESKSEVQEPEEEEENPLIDADLPIVGKVRIGG